MNFLECRIGGEDISIPIGDKLHKAFMSTNSKVNCSKRVAKMRKVYKGKIYDDLIVLSPTFLFALEDTLDELGYTDIIHNTILEFTIEQQYALFTLLRNGKSFRFLFHNRKLPFEIALTTIQSLFEKISLKML